MARTAGKKQAPAKIEEDDDAEGWEDAVVETDDKEAETNLRLRDWRDVERFREMKELRSLVDDDYGLEEIFHIPIKPRAEPGIPVPRKGLLKPLVAPAARPVPAKPAAKANPGPAPSKAAHHAPAKPAPAKPAKAHAKPAAAKKPPPAKLKAKAKRR